MSGLSLVVWAVLIGMLLWGMLRWAAQQPANNHVQLAGSAVPPSPVDLLRVRYVLGDIDALEFETMLDHVLASADSHEAALHMLEPRQVTWPTSTPGRRVEFL